MVLIRIIVLQGLIHNVRIGVKHVFGRLNYFSDALSRLKLQKFKELAVEHDKSFEEMPTEIPDTLWPMDKIWCAQK